MGHVDVCVCGNANMAAAGVTDTISSNIGDAGFEQCRTDGHYHEDVHGYGNSTVALTGFTCPAIR